MTMTDPRFISEREEVEWMLVETENEILNSRHIPRMGKGFPVHFW
jgi:hypothetical protein